VSGVCEGLYRREVLESVDGVMLTLHKILGTNHPQRAEKKVQKGHIYSLPKLESPPALHWSAPGSWNFKLEPGLRSPHYRQASQVSSLQKADLRTSGFSSPAASPAVPDSKKGPVQMLKSRLCAGILNYPSRLCYPKHFTRTPGPSPTGSQH
jgi:hypothetical protein